MSESVAVVGGGPVGCLAALAFSKLGFKVTVFEMRSNPLEDDEHKKSLRSINLAVSDRGIRAMRAVSEEMAERILQHVIPMKGRMIHDITGLKQESQLYGLFGESIKSIDRLFLNRCLVTELMNSDVEVHFNMKLVGLEHIGNEGDKPRLTFTTVNKETKSFDFDYAIGADGAHSQFRYQMQRGMRLDVSQKYVDMQYLELSIPPAEGAKPGSPESFSIDANHLHIWPRKDFMLIALANGDGSFTSTFFSPWQLIDSIKSASDFLAFFKSNFPDAYELIGEEALIYAFDKQPRGSLMQVAVSPYASPSSRVLLIGDAAHSMVPFYGQGMNCGFEDVHVLMQLIKKHGGVDKAFANYTEARQDDLRAICDLALKNFKEMSARVIDPFYLLRKKVDYFLGKASGPLFTWVPMYSMISFRGDIPYSKAVAIEKRQARILKTAEFAMVGATLALVGAKAYQAFRK